jgi:hypothetical protein
VPFSGAGSVLSNTSNGLACELVCELCKTAPKWQDQCSRTTLQSRSISQKHNRCFLHDPLEQASLQTHVVVCAAFPPYLCSQYAHARAQMLALHYSSSSPREPVLSALSQRHDCSADALSWPQKSLAFLTGAKRFKIAFAASRYAATSHSDMRALRISNQI